VAEHVVFEKHREFGLILCNVIVAGTEIEILQPLQVGSDLGGDLPGIGDRERLVE
jgi:hypothetical protein